MKRAITHLKLNKANGVKLEKLDTLALAYMALTQAYVDYIFAHSLNTATKYDALPPIETALSERWKRCAWQQAAGIMQSFFSNERETKPVLSAVAIQASTNVVVIEKSESSCFDYWLRVSTLDKGQPVRVPLRLYPKARKLLAEGKLCSGVTLNKKAGTWYATFVVETSTKKPRPDGSLIGVDLGIKNVITTSTGQQYGQFSDTLKKRVEQTTAKKRRKQQLNRCLEKKGKEKVSLADPKLSRFVKNETGRAINSFIKTLPPRTTIILENLSVRTMKFKSRLMNRVLSASQIGYTANHLRFKLNACQLRYRSVVAAYSSQECSDCGYIDEKNRPTQALFRCLNCGHTDKADLKASQVLIKRFGDTELEALEDYRQVKAVLLKRFYDRFPVGCSPTGGLDTEPLGVARAINGQSVPLMPISKQSHICPENG